MQDHAQKERGSLVAVAEIVLLGPFSMRIGGRKIGALPKKARALLAYLIARRGVTISRDTLTGLFWSDRGEAQARASLRQALSLIRKALGPAADVLLKTTREDVCVARDAVSVDFDRIEIDPNEGELGEFLEGLSLNEPAFERWLAVERANVRQRLAKALTDRAREHVEAQRNDDAETAYRKLLFLDPCDENAHRGLMEIYISSGRSDQAVSQYQACMRTLREALDVDPSEDTAAIYRKARAARQKPPSIEGDAEPRVMLAGTWDIDVPFDPGPILSEDGVTVVEQTEGNVAAEFANTSQALIVANALRLAAPAPARFGLAVEQDAELGAKKAGAVAADADPGQIDVSDAFFQIARRNSPCQFTVLSREIGERSAFRVAGFAPRQPFQASFVNAAPVSEKRDQSVAVAPFMVKGPDAAEAAYLADGLTEDLILELSRLKRLFVSSRTTVTALGDRDPTEIGDALGVKFVLTGTLRRLGDRVTITVSLIETETGGIVWSERLDISIENFLEAIEDIVGRVALTVSGRIEGVEMAVARLKRPQNMTAYDCYLRGIWHHRLGCVTLEHAEKAVKWLRQSIDADPTFGRARAAIACAWSDLPDYDLDEALQGCEIALRSDPTDPEVHRLMGAILNHKGDRDGARFHHERALEMAPNDAYIMGRVAAFHTFMGETDRALELIGRAEELDPFLPVYMVEERLIAEYVRGNYEIAVAEAARLPFQSRRSRYYTAAALVALNRVDEARSLIQEGVFVDKGMSEVFLTGQEHYYLDSSIFETLLERARLAGLPPE